MRVVLAGFALSGFAALGYEVAWTRLLIVTFSVISHYEFSIVLMGFLVGLALGSWLCSRYLNERRDLLSLFGLIELLIGVCGLLSIAVLASLPDLVGLVQSSRSWWTYRGGILAVSFLVMLMGATYPLVSRIYTRRLERVGHGLGAVGAGNSLGAVGGAFITGFVLMPLLGTEWSIKTLAALNIAAGLAALSFHPTLERRVKQRAWAGNVALLLALVARFDVFWPCAATWRRRSSRRTARSASPRWRSRPSGSAPSRAPCRSRRSFGTHSRPA